MTERTESLEARVDAALTVVGRGRSADGRLARKTLKAYRRAQREFEQWRRPRGYPMPTTSEALAAWAADLLQHGYAPSTVRGRLDGVKALHRERGWPVPDGVAAWSVLRGEDLTPAGPAEVNTVGRGALLAVAATCELGRPGDLRDLCMFTLAFDLLTDQDELVALDVGDVTQAGGAGLAVVLGGQVLRVPHDHAQPVICPACAAAPWLTALRGAGAQDGALFRAVDKGGNIAGTAPWAGRPAPGGRLNVRGLQKIWRRRVLAAGLPPDLTPRGLKLGGADDDVASGASIVATLRRGRWSPNTAAAVARLARAQEEGGGA